jgi:predicted transport protein
MFGGAKTMQDLKERKIRRLEAKITELYEQAYTAYWHQGNLACQKIEREILQVEASLREMS